MVTLSEANAQPASEAADRYAQAAFELAKASIGVDALEQDFGLLDAAFEASEELRAVARSPLIDPQDKVNALTAVASKIGMSELGRNVVGVAARNGRARELPAIGRAYRARLAAFRGAKMVEIISAAPLGQDELDQILKSLRSALGADVQPTTTVDARLIGGFVVRAGSRQFDASIRTKLDSLKLALKAS